MRLQGLVQTIALLLAVQTATAAPQRDTTKVARPCRPHSSHVVTSPNGWHSPLKAASRNTDKYRGQRRQLTILVDFADRQMLEHSTTAFWDDMLNTEGFTAFDEYQANPAQTNGHAGMALGSVHDYFYAQSYGLFDLHFDLYRVALDKSYKYYGENEGQDDKRYGQVVADAVNAIAGEVADWSVYDWDGDGTVEQVLVIYAGKGENDLGGEKDPDAIWPHQWTLTEAGIGTVTVGGYTVNSYCCTNEIDGSREYGTFGTLCHEFSHCFDLPDLYNTSSGGQWLGKWSVMDYGLYAHEGFRPVGYSAYERAWMGWLEPEVLAEPATVAGLQPLNEQAKAYKVLNDNYPDEYYLIELRQQTEWDEDLPGSGVVITHIDFDDTAWTVNNNVNSSSRKRYDIFKANNSTYSRAGWAYPWQSNDQLTDTSTPAATLYHANADGTLRMGKPITDISVQEDADTQRPQASFRFMGGADTSVRPQADLSATGTKAVYDLRGRYLGTSLSGLPHGVYIVRQTQGGQTVTLRAVAP